MARASSAPLSARHTAGATSFGLSERALRLLHEARLLLALTLALYLLLVLGTYDRADPGWSHAVPVERVRNLGGRVGAWVADLMLYLFGMTAYLWLTLAGVLVWRELARLRAQALSARGLPERADEAARFAWERWLGFGLLILGCAGLESSRLQALPVRLPLAPGGVVGDLLATPLAVAVGPVGATLVLLLMLAVGLSLFAGVSWLAVFERVGLAIELACQRVVGAVTARQDRRIGEQAAVARTEQVQEKKRVLPEPEAVRIEPPAPPAQPSLRAQKERQAVLFSTSDLPADSELPVLALLDEPAQAQQTISPEALDYTSRLIEKKLSDFGVSAAVVAAYPGPVITRYEIEPATGVKGSQIVNLSKDLARALSLVSIRVVETIPGKNLMGLELPNPRRQTVRLSEILGSSVYADSASPVTLALGVDIAGAPVCADLARMPHLLVAGTTGSGKSVGINAMLLSLLYKADPSEVRLILIDPKMLEMAMYEGIPHLLAPVVTDMRQAGHALNWCVAEMERRYKLMSKLGVRNLSGFNARINDAERRGEPVANPFSLTPDQPEPLGPLPLVVVVIDELADLMMVVGKKIEELIARLAQKARAAGIHLILATQRPSVDVITGLIKANIPTRIAFQVSSKIDSRTILDQMGAESLLGMGDMLYMPPGNGLPQRVHGAFVADDEVQKVVEHWKQRGQPDYVDGILEGGLPEEIDTGSAVGFGGLSPAASGAEGEGGESDALYDQAVAVVLKHRRASISLVQRHLRIGYNRAARLLEQMEASGVVSAMATNGNRDILVPAREEA